MKLWIMLQYRHAVTTLALARAEFRELEQMRAERRRVASAFRLVRKALP